MKANSSFSERTGWDLARLATVFLLTMMMTLPARGQDPGWSVAPSAFAASMTVVGTFSVDGIASTDPGDRLAAFAGEAVRGMAAPVAVTGGQVFFLTLYANADGEALTFRAYQAATGQVLELNEPLVFSANAFIGSPTAPFAWTATRPEGQCAIGRPTWAFNPADYEATMTVTAALEIDGTPAGGPDDLVAAFADDQVRGVAQPIEVNGQWMFFLTTYANSGGETLTFRAYESATNLVREIAEALPFAANAIHGAPSAPVVWQGSCETSVHATAIERADGAIPTGFALSANYPNPFNPETTIEYALAEAGPVRLVVFDLLGREVAVLAEGMQAAGRYQARFDATGLPSGLYLYRLEAPGFSQTRQMVLLK